MAREDGGVEENNADDGGTDGIRNVAREDGGVEENNADDGSADRGEDYTSLCFVNMRR